MDRLAFTAANAITEQTLARQQLVHELANISTVGFKRSYDMAATAIKAEGSGYDTRVQPQALAKDVIRLAGGTVMVTGRNLDIAMSGTTVLGVTAPDGTLAFTRRGDLHINSQGVIETGSGQVVRGVAGPLNVPAGFNIRINPDGTIYATDPAQPGNRAGQQVGRLLLRDAGKTDLGRRQDGLYEVAGEPPGTDITAGNQAGVGVTPGALEGSNVNAIQAMVRLMDQSRSFEQNIKIIKESKDLDEAGATMMRAQS